MPCVFARSIQPTPRRPTSTSQRRSHPEIVERPNPLIQCIEVPNGAARHHSFNRMGAGSNPQGRSACEALRILLLCLIGSTDKAKGTNTLAKKNTDRVTGKRAYITGASSGIGEAFARRLAQDRYDLTVIARNKERLEKVAEELRDRHSVGVRVLPADLTKTVSVKKVERAIEGDEQAHILVNNAGFGTMGDFAELDFEREEEQIRLNVLALVRLTRAALPGMLRRHRGAIINVSSLAGLQPGPGTATYSATKAFVTSFSESIGEETRGSGVQIQSLCPGFTRTEFQQRAEIDTSALPQAAWMSAKDVVDESIDGLQRGEIVCIPGFLNRLLASTVTSIPRPVARRILGYARQQLLEGQTP